MKALTQIRIFFIENVRTFRLAPVEMAIACYYFIISILGEHTDIKPSQDQIMIMPFALILAILCNKWFTTHKSICKIIGWNIPMYIPDISIIIIAACKQTNKPFS